jgi:hypothetical protein
VERVEAIPGVVRASTACCMPLETVWQLAVRDRQPEWRRLDAVRSDAVPRFRRLDVRLAWVFRGVRHPDRERPRLLLLRTMRVRRVWSSSTRRWRADTGRTEIHSTMN